MSKKEIAIIQLTGSGAWLPTEIPRETLKNTSAHTSSQTKRTAVPPELGSRQGLLSLES